MTDYSKMKNAELENLLKERKLPHTGKKADMVARLQEADKSTPSAETPKPAEAKPATTTAAEDEIDWDDDADTNKPSETIKPEDATTEPAAAAIAAGGQGQVANPQAVPNQKVDIDPSQTDDLAVKAPTDAPEGAEQPAEEKEEEKPAVDFTSGIKETSLEEELEKRRARAKKFGISDEDSEKMLERAKKFGTEASGPSGLNEALPERQRKRGREGGDEGGRGGKRGRRGGRGGRPGDRGDSRRDNNRVQKSGAGGTWMSDADKAKADARKARFASATDSAPAQAPAS